VTTLQGRSVCAILVLAAGLAGALLGRTLAPARSAGEAPLCRPSAPALAAARHDGPVVLMLGNSQIFDGNWDLGPSLVINCARQGQTAEAALRTVSALPELDADAIVLGFGAVEAIRDGRAIDPDAFRNRMEALIGSLRARWPAARLLVATVPPMRSDLLPDRYRAASEAVTPLSAALRALAGGRSGIRISDPARVMATDAGGLSAAMSHDGIHLTPAAYALWSREMTELLDGL
jgi:lysophospholipase L1-like esterase